ncbi:hypothetical protein IE81DRAFT_365709 [Ceraceosorus guamensis]|uniref:DUF6604 domain-containing protein n=1 Tax=Ceraceosorus guamensis TaxID=1522189 RepID=A0A316W1C2_9BASI|nr:hypothetical protein IE81DRAFT_365709 [Ceraceosorus guamensis]PWN43479.1 hypothetical protein IE81DRAFT_365709 [Ceraceosorus guamensis]
MAGPRFVRSRYEQYKRDTQEIANWLGREALRHGFNLGSLVAATQSESSEDVNIKKKKKKQKKKNGKKSSQSQSSSQSLQTSTSTLTSAVQQLELGSDARVQASVEGEQAKEALQDDDDDDDDDEEDEDDQAAPTLAQTSSSTGIKQHAQQLRGKFVLRTAQYTQIARYLVQRGVAIPSEVRTLVQRCSNRRSAFLRASAGNETYDKAGHNHFISVLGEVSAIFGRAPAGEAKSNNGASASGAQQLPGRTEVLETRASPLAGGPTSDNPYAPLLNLFSGADEGTELPDVRLPGTRPAEGAKDPASEASFEVEMSRDFALLLLLSFYDDLHEVRQHIKTLWIDYREGRIDLITASVTSNAGLELLRKPHDEVMKVIALYYDDWMAAGAALFLVRQMLFLLLDQIDLTLRNFDDPDIEACPQLSRDTLEYLFLPNLSIMRGVADISLANHVPLCKPGHFGKLTPTTTPESWSFTKRNEQLTVLLTESLPEYWLVPPFELPGARDMRSGTVDAEVLDPNDPSNDYRADELSLEMSHLRRTVFADINWVLGEKVKEGLALLRSSASGMARTMKNRRKVEGPVAPNGWPRGNEVLIERFTERADAWSRTDLIAQSKIMFARRLGAPLEDFKESLLLPRNPLFCGVQLFKFQLEYQMMGFTIANAWSSILMTVHLFVACRNQEKSLDRPANLDWADLDLVMELHGVEDIFGGPIPKNVIDSMCGFMSAQNWPEDAVHSFKRWLNGGTSQNDLARIQQAQRHTFDCPLKPFQDHSQMLQIFQEKYRSRKQLHSDIDINYIQQLLSDLKRKEEEAEEAEMQSTQKGKKTRGKKQGVRGLRRSRKHNDQKFSIVQLLSVLEVGLIRETASIRFDYVSMHLRCVEFLKEVKREVNEYFTRKHGATWIEDDTQIAYVAGYILTAASFSQLGASQLGLQQAISKTGAWVASKVLYDATRVFRRVLGESQAGDAEIRKIALSRARAER